MSADINRGGLSLVTTNPMDDADQQGQGPMAPDASDTTGTEIIDSRQSSLYSSITASIYDALHRDESFECLIEEPYTGLKLVHILVAIKYYELIGELSGTEAKNLRGECEDCMLKAKVAPKDIHAAGRAAKTFTIEGMSQVKPYDILSVAIEESLFNGYFMCLTETNTGFKERPILESIFRARRKGKISDNQAFTLAKKCIDIMKKSNVERRAQEFIEIYATGLLKSQRDAEELFDMMELTQIEIDLFKEELAKIGVIAAPTPVDTTDWEPRPSPEGWYPEAFVVERDGKNPLIPEEAIVLLRNREVRRAALGVVALAAIAAIGIKLLPVVNEESPQIRRGTKEPAAITEIQPNAIVNPPAIKNPRPDTDPEEIKSTVSALARAATFAPATPVPQEQPAATAPATPVPQEQPAATAPATPVPQEQPAATAPAIATPQDRAPEIAAPATPQPKLPADPQEPATQGTISLPIATKPGTYGGVALDEAASRKLWGSAGYAVKARMGAGGKKVFVLSKGGQSFAINNTKVTEGQTGIIASLE